MSRIAGKGGAKVKRIVHVVRVVLAMMMVTTLGVAAGQEPKKETAPKGTTTKQELIDLENEWVAALAKADAAALDGMLADTYADSEGGQRTDKQGVLEALKSGDLKIESLKLSEMRVYNYGDAAVVTGIGEQTGTFKGQKLAAKVLFTDTFVKRAGKWKAVASHRSAVS